MFQSLTIRVSELTASHVSGTTSQGDMVRLPKSCISGTPTIGEDLYVVGVSKAASSPPEEPLARALLNQLLSPPTP